MQSKWLIILIGVLSYLAATFWVLFQNGLFEASFWKSPPAEKKSGGINDFLSLRYHNPEIDQLMMELQDEKEALAKRRSELDDLATRLENERSEIYQVTQTVHRMQMDLEKTIVKVKVEETDNLKKLAKIYAAMSPEGAADILKEMPDSQIVKILMFARDRETAPILETFAQLGDTETKRAAMISDRLRLAIAEEKDSLQ